MNLPLVPFEFFLFSILLCFAAGMVASMLLFLFVFERKPRHPHSDLIKALRRHDQRG
jgi:hypothetical protein